MEPRSKIILKIKKGGPKISSTKRLNVEAEEGGTKFLTPRHTTADEAARADDSTGLLVGLYHYECGGVIVY